MTESVIEDPALRQRLLLQSSQLSEHDCYRDRALVEESVGRSRLGPLT
jgi:hypothetical protein